MIHKWITYTCLDTIASWLELQLIYNWRPFNELIKRRELIGDLETITYSKQANKVVNTNKLEGKTAKL